MVSASVQDRILPRNFSKMLQSIGKERVHVFWNSSVMTSSFSSQQDGVLVRIQEGGQEGSALLNC